jgi:RNA polymerase sigma-70 factor, ECF subfamily
MDTLGERRDRARIAGPIPEYAFAATLAAARLGEEWAVAALWRDLHPRLLRYLRVALRDGSAEDTASDVWLEVAQGLCRFDGDERAFRAWVFTIARRRAIDAARKARRRRTSPAAPETIAAMSASSLDVDAEARLALDSALARVALLRPDQAEVILLRVLGDLSVEETARIVGKRPGAVRVLQHRALQRLRDSMAAENVTPRAGDAIFEADGQLTA